MKRILKIISKIVGILIGLPVAYSTTSTGNDALMTNSTGLGTTSVTCLCSGSYGYFLRYIGFQDVSQSRQCNTLNDN